MSDSVMGLTADVLQILHVVGLALGFGGAIFADVLSLHTLVSSRVGAIGPFYRRTRSIVFFGLILIWVSGLGVAAVKYDWHTLPDEFFLKIALTALLTLNAVFVTRRFLPLIDTSPRPIAVHLSKRQIGDLVLAAGISITCWLAAFMVVRFSLLEALNPERLVEWAFAFWLLCGLTMLGLIMLRRATASLRARWAERQEEELAVVAPAEAVPTEVAPAEVPHTETAPPRTFIQTLIQRAESEVDPMVYSPAPALRPDQHLHPVERHESAPKLRERSRRPDLAAPRMRALRYFQEHAPDVLLKLARAAYDYRYEEVMRAAYALKSMSLAVHARRLASVCARLEADASQGPVDNLRFRLDELKGELMRVLTFIESSGEPQPRSNGRNVTGYVDPTMPLGFSEEIYTGKVH